MQQPPELHAKLIITGNVPIGTDVPFEHHVTQQLGVTPTEAECENGLLIWEYAIPKESHWELPETLGKLLQPFDPKRLKLLLNQHGLYAEAQIACYVTDSHPAINFSTELLGRLVELGVHLDLDLYRTASARNNRDIL